MSVTQPTYILGIESSCDDTSAAIIRDREILSNITANQQVHQVYGGVVPELASRAHQQNILPVIDAALKSAKIDRRDLSAIAYTKGPGLLGSLMVGGAFARSMAQALEIPLYGVHHMEAHILAHCIQEEGVQNPDFPFLCLTVSGGHTQIVRVDSPRSFHLLGETIDDAAGEAFDKAAKIMGLPYPGGPEIDKLAQEGDPKSFSFGKPRIEGLDFSFSGLKTSFLYTIQKGQKEQADFVQKNQADLAASLQKSIIDILIEKLNKASVQTGIKEIAIAGGVSANSGLRDALLNNGRGKGWNCYIPPMRYCTDNGAMIAITGYFMHQNAELDKGEELSKARWGI
jgi:N6-L-threonylcarbamoyladenine synthase